MIYNFNWLKHKFITPKKAIVEYFCPFYIGDLIKKRHSFSPLKKVFLQIEVNPPILISINCFHSRNRQSLTPRVSIRHDWVEGSKGVRGLWVIPQEKIKSFFLILVLKMAYFNWNVIKIWKIFLFSLPTRGGGISPLFGAEWGGLDPNPLPPAETLTPPIFPGLL